MASARQVINMHTIKPLDEEAVMAAAAKTGKIVTVEEHSVIGGLGSAVCDVVAEKAPAKVLKIGVNDVYGESGPAAELIKKYGLDSRKHLRKGKSICKIGKERKARHLRTADAGLFCAFWHMASNGIQDKEKPSKD